MKKIITLLIVICMTLLGTMSAMAADVPLIDGVEQDIVNYLWEIPADASDEEFTTLMYRNMCIIKEFQLLFTEESYDAYYKIYNKEYRRNPTIENAKKVVESQSLLVQKNSIADGAWLIWNEGGNVNGYEWFTNNVGPVVDGELEELTEEALDASKIDSYGQAPILVKCLLDDPSQAKGNIILISGGGFQDRSNTGEGYPAIPVFNELGYNCFLLQRRVAPFSQMDIFMDLQRSIRLVRYYAEIEGWGGQDMIAAAGFSGGGGTIMGTVFNCYGDLTPVDVGATAYIPDEIDAVNSDLDVAMPIYGAISSLIVDGNENLPAFYIAQGDADDTVDPQNAIDTYDYVKDKTNAQLYMIPGAKHAFGPGTSSNCAEGCRVWPSQADEFMMANLGHSGN